MQYILAQTGPVCKLKKLTRKCTMRNGTKQAIEVQGMRCSEDLLFRPVILNLFSVVAHRSGFSPLDRPLEEILCVVTKHFSSW